MNNTNLTYSQITTLAGNLKMLSGQIEDLLSVLKEQDYVRIGDNGDIWTGDAADMARQTFDELVAKIPNFINSINEYADYLVNVVAQR